jgi:hypothetical protein
VEYAPNVLGLLFIVHDYSEVEAVRIAIGTVGDDAAWKSADKRRVFAARVIGCALRRGNMGRERQGKA